MGHSNMISVIIPVLNADKELPKLLDALEQQTVGPEEIIVVDSESLDGTAAIARERAKVLSVKRAEFDHGKTRDWALREAKGNIVVFLTQDAVPARKDFLEKLIRPLEEEKVAVVTGRQLPKADASPMEKLIRAFNYPAESHVRSEADVEQMGIKAFFCSDVCAAYNRKIYEDIGGFDYPLKTNEDMFFAANAIRSGYKVAYAADAQVFHSHNFTLKEQYERNKIQGYEIERHRDVLGNVSKEAEGKKLVKFVSLGLLRRGQISSFVYFGLDCVARYLGSRAGRKAYLKNG